MVHTVTTVHTVTIVHTFLPLLGVWLTSNESGGRSTGDSWTVHVTCPSQKACWLWRTT